MTWGFDGYATTKPSIQPSPCSKLLAYLSISFCFINTHPLFPLQLHQSILTLRQRNSAVSIPFRQHSLLIPPPPPCRELPLQVVQDDSAAQVVCLAAILELLPRVKAMVHHKDTALLSRPKATATLVQLNDLPTCLDTAKRAHRNRNLLPDQFLCRLTE